jgi:hypothetical protein
MSDVEQAVEQQMLQKADQFIDRVIPPEGLVTFDAPGGGGFFGFGAAEDGDLDLMDTGTAAFAGFFGGMVDPDDPTDAFGGLGELGRWGFRRFRNRMKSFRRARKRFARKTLRKVGGFHRRMMGRAKGLIRKAGLTRNPFQRGKLLNKAKAAAGQAAKAKKAATKLAKETVAPRISRAEARVAMRPVVKQMAKSIAKPAKGMMKKMAAIKKVPGGQKMLAEAARKGTLQKKLTTAMEKSVAKSVGKKAAPKAKKKPFWKRWFRPRRRRWGFFGLGQDDGILDAAIATELEEEGMGQFLVSSEGEVGLPTVAGMGEGTSSYLSMGDMETVSQEPDTMDIVKSWDTDDIYGEPLGV